MALSNTVRNTFAPLCDGGAILECASHAPTQCLVGQQLSTLGIRTKPGFFEKNNLLPYGEVMDITDMGVVFLYPLDPALI